jgi:glyoxylase-like metal-dependent hydrolase (beta-lactamase superfamily II)
VGIGPSSFELTTLRNPVHGFTRSIRHFLRDEKFQSQSQLLSMKNCDQEMLTESKPAWPNSSAIQQVGQRCTLILMETLLLILSTSSLCSHKALAQSPDPLQRAIAAIGGAKALERAKTISVVMVGTQDRMAVDQGYYATRPSPARAQETLIIDEDSRRAALRREAINSEGSPNTWRSVVQGENSYSMNLKSGWVLKMSAEVAVRNYETWGWMIPQFALADMERRRSDLHCGVTQTIRGSAYDVCKFSTSAGTPFTVLFSQRSGELTGYEYDAVTMRGPTRMHYEFKPYGEFGIGRFPTGYRFTIGSDLYKDMNVIDARTPVLVEHPWFVPPPPDPGHAVSVRGQPAGSTEEVAPGVWFVRNVGGYNSMFVRVGDCVAVFDAVASFGAFGNALPSPNPPRDLSAIVLAKIKEVTNKKVCYVIPTHHHDDHFGGIAGFARAGATIITTPNNVGLAREVTRRNGMPSPPNIQVVRKKMTLGSGAERIDIWSMTNEQHAESMLFFHLPGRRIVFEGDLTDYIPSLWNFMHFIDRQGLKVERVFSVHSATSHSLKNLQTEDPEN